VSELIRHGRAVGSVFDLLGCLENDMTDALGFTLSRSPALLRLLISDLGYTDALVDDAAVISVQTHRAGHGVTDLEIRIGEDFLAILEAKSGAALPSQAQLALYAGVLAEHHASSTILVALTNATQHAASTALGLLSIPGADLTHRSWRQIRELAIHARTKDSNRAKALLEDFIAYLGGIVGMETKFDNRVYVVSLGAGNPEAWSLSWVDIVEKRGSYFYPVGKNWPDPPNYLGFRYGGQLRRIHHVDSVEVIHNFHDVFPEAPDEVCDPHYCFQLGPAIVPDHVVKAGPRVVRAARVWCAIDALLTSTTISEALDETARRSTEQ
jgi:hypothetical protein